MFFLEVPVSEKGCGIIPLKLAAQMCSIATLLYIVFTFFDYYEVDDVVVRNQFYFYLIQILGAASVSFILWSTFKKQENFAKLGLTLHNVYVLIRIVVFVVTTVIVIFNFKFGDFFLMIIYVGLEFLAMVYFNYVFFCFVKNYDMMGENVNAVSDSGNKYEPPQQNV